MSTPTRAQSRVCSNTSETEEQAVHVTLVPSNNATTHAPFAPSTPANFSARDITCQTLGMRVYLGADHAGLEFKNQIIEHLTATGHEPVDCGAFDYDPVDDYPAFCIDAARRVVADPGSRGLVLGGSGNGEQIAANKVPGARCALAWSVETAKLAREHNDAQLIGIGGRMHTLPEALAIVDAFLGTPFSGEERHQRRIDILSEYERSGEAPEVPGKPE